MTGLRAAKVEAVAKSIPPMNVFGERTGKVLVLGWGGTHGAITTAAQTLQAEGYSVSSASVRYLNPLPPDLGDLIKGFEKVLVPELNLGQLSMILRSKFLIDAIPMGKVKGRPFRVSEIRERILELLNH
jgi:2-oxoglutarate ferredoxin oxidoreductase subunit alpha